MDRCCCATADCIGCGRLRLKREKRQYQCRQKKHFLKKGRFFYHIVLIIIVIRIYMAKISFANPL
jgi:hypothetical protein